MSETNEHATLDFSKGVDADFSQGVPLGTD